MARSRASRARWGALAFLAFAGPAWADTTALETAVKATYLYKLAPFVAWPATAFNAADDPLVICIQGPDSFAGLVQRAAAGQRVGTHPIQVRHVARIERSSGCHIAYVAGSQAQSASQALSAVDGSPVLTVTDAEHGPARGIVHLVLNGGKVRFSVNAGEAGSDGLTISSKLLALALQVAR
jgi:hypothetical protein